MAFKYTFIDVTNATPAGAPVLVAELTADAPMPHLALGVVIRLPDAAGKPWLVKELSLSPMIEINVVGADLAVLVYVTAG
ncbi:hypothetical protein AB4156_21565 [Cupriavidus sp. 2MCAB6]|uniref:hypothetical protein n=1 Tax=Cupriavidus sp. 2MCAB6 TaxID=3232981 RepID=UPI003F8E9588